MLYLFCQTKGMACVGEGGGGGERERGMKKGGELRRAKDIVTWSWSDTVAHIYLPLNDNEEQHVRKLEHCVLLLK